MPVIDRIAINRILFLAVCTAGGIYAVLLWSPCAAATDAPHPRYAAGPGYEHLSTEGIRGWVHSLTEAGDHGESGVLIHDPVPGAVMPPDLAPPLFSWDGEGGEGASWLLRLDLGTRPLVRVVCDDRYWVPDVDLWEWVRREASGGVVRVRVSAIGGWDGHLLLPSAHTSFSFAPEPVSASLLYLQLPVPFDLAHTHPRLARWRVGSPASGEPPPVVLENMPVCANCHVFAQDGSVFGMDMDIDGDKGAFLLRPLSPRMRLHRDDFITWNGRPTPPPARFSFGLFARISPNGRFVAATVGETSVFMKLDDPVFSQLFFPATGRIGIYDCATGRHRDLPGADRSDQVQTGPEWSPDGRTLAFSRAAVSRELVAAVQEGRTLAERPDQSIHELNRRYPIRFDIWTVPFNQGHGGEPRPLAGASANGMSNFFPRYSPDGRWIVFTQAPTGLVLQPGSILCIVPAEGGEARVLACSLPGMNSWHSWSPNGRWLAYAGKRGHTLTEIFLAYIDEAGEAHPPVRMFRFSEPGRAAALPEFLPRGAPMIEEIALGFATRSDRVSPGRNER